MHNGSMMERINLRRFLLHFGEQLAILTDLCDKYSLPDESDMHGVSTFEPDLERARKRIKIKQGDSQTNESKKDEHEEDAAKVIIERRTGFIASGLPT